MIVGAILGVGLMVLAFRNKDRKPGSFDEVVGTLKQDWARTGNIDFHAAAIESGSPQTLILRVEEKKVT